jgi:hypothetical protein
MPYRQSQETALKAPGVVISRPGCPGVTQADKLKPGFLTIFGVPMLHPLVFDDEITDRRIGC